LSRLLKCLVKRAGDLPRKQRRAVLLFEKIPHRLSSFMSEFTSKQIVGARSGVHLLSVKLDVARDFAASINNKNSTEECAIRNGRMKPKFRWKNINQVDEPTNQEILGRFMRSKGYDSRQPTRKIGCKKQRMQSEVSSAKRQLCFCSKGPMAGVSTRKKEAILFF